MLFLLSYFFGNILLSLRVLIGKTLFGDSMNACFGLIILLLFSSHLGAVIEETKASEPANAPSTLTQEPAPKRRVVEVYGSPNSSSTYCAICAAKVQHTSLTSFLEHLLNKHPDQKPQTHASTPGMSWYLLYSYELKRN